MQQVILPVAFLAASTAVACSFQVGTKSQNPNAPTPAGQAAAPATPARPGTPAPAPTPKIASMGRLRVPGSTPTAPAGPAGPGTSTPANPSPPLIPPAPAGMPVLAGTGVFGNGTADPTGWKGSYYVIPPASQKMPALSSLTPGGVLFAKELNVAQKAMTGGFPGIDASRNENFAIRWEAPLVVENEADYNFRLVSDDGTLLLIDSTPIIDNDGARDSAKEKSGPVHLVKGTHVITVDYFQATGPVALQLFCAKTGGTESICPLKL